MIVCSIPEELRHTISAADSAQGLQTHRSKEACWQTVAMRRRFPNQPFSQSPYERDCIREPVAIPIRSGAISWACFWSSARYIARLTSLANLIVAIMSIDKINNRKRWELSGTNRI